jgi:hypothetical protein
MLDSETPAAAGIALCNLDQLTDDERQLGNALDLERESSALVLDLDQIADLIDNGRTDEALRLIANARTKQLTKAPNRASSKPMDIVNEVALLVDQVLGIADLLTCAPADELVEETLMRVGYTIEGILERAKNRLSEARDYSVAERKVLCRGLEMLLNDCKTDAEFAIATRLQSELEVANG